MPTPETGSWFVKLIRALFILLLFSGISVQPYAKSIPLSVVNPATDVPYLVSDTVSSRLKVLSHPSSKAMAAAQITTVKVDNQPSYLSGKTKLQFEARADHVRIRALIIAVLALSCTFYFVLVGPPRIPSTYETSVCLYTLLAGYLAFSATALFLSMSVLKACSINSNLAGHFLGIVLMTPIIGLLLAIFLLLRQVKSIRSTAKFFHNKEENQHLEAVVQEVADTLGIKRPIETFFTPTCHGPNVIGTNPSNAILVFPSTISHQISMACQHDSDQSQALSRLVIAHELSHIRNGDIRFLPLLHAVQNYLPTCLVLIITAYLITLGSKGASQIMELVTPSLRFFLIGGLLLVILMKWAMQQRERLADATAVLAVKEDDLRQLLQPDERNTSILERLFFSFRFSSIFPKAMLGFRLPVTTRSWWQYLPFLNGQAKKRSVFASIQKADSNRVHELVGKLVSFPITSASSWITSLSLGAIAGMVLSAFSNILLIDLIHALNSSSLAINGQLQLNFETIYAQWIQAHNNSLSWVLFRGLASPALAFIVIGGVMLKLRDLSHDFRISNKMVLINLSLQGIAAIVYADVIFIIASPSIQSSFPFVPDVSVFHSYMWPLMLCIVAMYSATLLMRRGAPIQRLRSILIETTIALFFLSLGFVGSFLMLTGLPPISRILSALLFIAVGSSVFHFEGLRKYFDVRDYSEEFIRWIRVWGRHRIFVNKTGGVLRIDKAFLLWICLTCASTYFIFPCILSLLFEPFLIYLEHNRFHSAWFGIIVLPTIGFSLPLLLLYNAHFRRTKGMHDLEQAGAMTMLIQYLELQHLRTIYASQLLKALDENRQRSAAFVSEVVELPLFIRTCCVIQCLKTLNLDRSHYQHFEQWLDECESSTGGYGPVPKSISSIPHTAIALQTIRLLERRPSNPNSIHKEWLERELNNFLKRNRELSPSEWLAGIRYAIYGLKACGGEASQDPTFRESISQQCFQLWLTTRRTTRDTLNLLIIIRWWDHPDSTIISWVQKHWLPIAEARWVALQPGVYVNELADAIQILRLIMPETYKERVSAIRIADNITKGFLRTTNPPNQTHSLLQNQSQNFK